MPLALELLPKDKHDFQGLEELFKLNPEMVEPHFGVLLEWLQDINWPIAQTIAEYLAQQGKALIPFVKEVLNGKDRVWQYNILVYIVDKWPVDIVTDIQGELENLAKCSILDDEVDLRALGILVNHNFGDSKVLRRQLDFKLSGIKGILQELLAIERIMNDRNRAKL
ncbi:MAG: hypothetical protein CTY16_13790 [Methylobacter sp.]|nr:MAG: hypothetical protein CTY16_13790 [Methylobacter sp.]